MKNSETSTYFSLQSKEGSTKFSLKLDYQENKISSFAEYYTEHLENMSSKNKFSTNFEITEIELELTMNMRLN